MQREWKIGAACEKSFEELEGSGARRYCDQCRLHVHDFSQMKRADIAEFMDGSRGRVCAQILYGIDGAMVTADAPTGRQRVRRAFLKTAASVGLLWLGLRKPLGAQEVKGLRGVVLDLLGGAVPRAKVVVRDGDREVAQVVADEQGRFAIDVEVAGSYQVSVQSPGFASFSRLVREFGNVQEVRVILKVGSMGAPEVEVSPIADAVPGAGVRGVAVDSSGVGIAGAVVRAIDGGGKVWPMSATTDAKGAFVMSLPIGVWTVRIERQGYVGCERDVDLHARVENLWQVQLSSAPICPGILKEKGNKRSWWGRMWGR